MIRALIHPSILRLYLLGLLLAVGMGALLVRLWSFQVEMREDFEAKLPTATTIRVRIPAVRGEIRDRNGIVLATNERNYALVVDLGELRRAWHNDPQEKQLKTKREDLGALFDAYLRPRLSDAGVETEVSAAQVDRHWRINKEYVSMLLREHLSWEEVSRISVRSDKLPGVRVVTRPQRRYLYGALAGHAVGYLRPGNVDDLDEHDRKAYKFDILDDVGVAGVEASMDELLRGIPGEREILQDVNGVVVGEVGYTPPVRGSDVYLTIDLRLQYIAERALRDAGVGQGAAVVIDPRDGSLLAMASVPSFDPNHFIPTISAEMFKAYGERGRFDPLLAQALRPTEPGSTYKVPVALAGGLSGVHRNGYACSPYNPGGSHAFRCWIYRQSGGSHGSVNLADSLKVSCNGFYYRYGNAMGADSFTKGLALQGMGQLSGVELKGVGENPGLLPGTDTWRRAYGHADGYKPNAGDLANASIGQGGVLATPMQMAAAVGTIANGGTFYQTRVISHAIDVNGQVAFDNLPHVRARLQDEGIPQDAVDNVREGMRRVVNEPGGTGKRGGIEDWVVAGKTGTAQTSRVGRSNAWFIAFAPYEAPRYAVCILVRNGKSGGTAAGPVSKRILEGAYALEQGQSLNLTALGEAQGHDDIIDVTDYGEEPLEDLQDVPQEDTVGGDAPELVDTEVISEETPLMINDEGYVDVAPIEAEPVEAEPVEATPVVD